MDEHLKERRETVSIRLSMSIHQQLERMRVAGGFRTRAALLESLITALLRDDAKAHDEEI